MIKVNGLEEKSKKRLLHALSAMKQRCYNPNDKRYKAYGAKGVKVCKEWLNSSKSFCEWALRNGYKDNLTIDRINPNGNYEPCNCRWVNYKEQENNRTNNRIIKINNQYKTMAQWADYYGVSYTHFQGKIRYHKKQGYFTLNNGIKVHFEIIK